ncbi:MAG: TRAM domain-containing protein [Desulfurococcaceae archaeon]
MTKHRQRKHAWSPYTSDIQRLSSYPRVAVPEGDALRAGEVVVVEIKGIDDDGNGVANLAGVKIVVAGAEPGTRARVLVTKVNDGVAYGRILEVVGGRARER